MKRLLTSLSLIATLMLIASATASAQWSIGAGLGYGSDIKELGLDIRGYYDLAKVAPNFMAVAEFMYWTGTGEFVTAWNLDFNGQYSFNKFNNGRFYGLAGLDFAHSSADLGPIFGTVSNTEVGLNIGAGVEGDVGVKIFGEIKYVLGNADQLVLTGGVRIPVGDQ